MMVWFGTSRDLPVSDGNSTAFKASQLKSRSNPAYLPLSRTDSWLGAQLAHDLLASLGIVGNEGICHWK